MDVPLIKSNAERQRDFRAKRKAAGKPVRSKTSGQKQKGIFERGEFIALDGEGESNGEVETFTIGDGKTYRAPDHIYTLLAASSGESLFNRGHRLSTQSCIDFLSDLGAAHKRAIFVIFAGGYDINHILMFGFEKEILQKISRGETYEYEHQGVWYHIEFRARKSLTLKRNRSFKIDKKGNYKCVWQDTITIWDVFGFFQESFVGVMGKWLGTDYKHYELIKTMKQKRGDFANVKQKTINDYNQAELESLVEIMRKVRDAVAGLDLKCYRWDGAGSIAAALFRKHAIKEYKCESPEAINEATRIAYAGGRIEICKLGFHDGEVFDYDINSAYPSVMKHLPCLKCGQWQQKNSNQKVLDGFTLVHLKFKFDGGQPFYPLFYRTSRMQISFPSEGEGWYWYPEYEAAQRCPGTIEVLESFTYSTACQHKPFDWIEGYYETRKQWLKNPTEEWQKGGEKIIKLGLNSLYGKTAQQLGGVTGKPPAYHQLEWAGYITSSTRARLFTAATQSPQSIIGFATDGIFSTEPLALDISSKKHLGAWELKSPSPTGLTMAMAGVYWWHYGANKFDHFSRGFDKDTMKTPHLILSAWAQGLDQKDIPMHRLIGMGSACTSKDLWKVRGRFTEGFRTLRLDGKSHKRNPCNVKKDKPHKHLVDLEASLNLEYAYGLQGCSFPYPIKWIDGIIDGDHETDLEISRENADTENI